LKNVSEIRVEGWFKLLQGSTRGSICINQVSNIILSSSFNNRVVKKLVFLSPFIAQTFLYLCLWKISCLARIFWCW
jgi:hypothetical protein